MRNLYTTPVFLSLSLSLSLVRIFLLDTDNNGIAVEYVPDSFLLR